MQGKVRASVLVSKSVSPSEHDTEGRRELAMCLGTTYDGGTRKG